MKDTDKVDIFLGNMHTVRSSASQIGGRENSRDLLNVSLALSLAYYYEAIVQAQGQKAR